jgi:glycosyltransferase involved in cell wall biosynthesis
MLFIDVTNSVNISHTTGIQRVVRNIYKYGVDYGENKDIVFVEYEGLQGNYFIVRKNDRRMIAGRRVPLSSKISNKVIFEIAESGLSIFGKEVLLGIAMKFRVLFGDKPRIKLSTTTRLGERNPSDESSEREGIRIQKGDYFILADSTWNYDPWAEIKKFRETGVTLIHIVYDLLPLEYPEFFDQGLVKAFKKWHQAVHYYVDYVYCISNTVSIRFEALAETQTITNVQKARVFQLGNDLTPVISREEKTIFDPTINDWVKIPEVTDRSHNQRRQTQTSDKKDLNSDVMFVSVGTIEPRKNYDFLLDMFEKIWAHNELPVQWHIAGREGWECDRIIWRIKHHPLLGKYLFHHDSLNDELLANLYLQSDCAIIGSVDEGYGLPIVEASKYGCDLLVSDIEVFREFQLEDVSYFLINDGGDDMLNKVNHYIKDLKGRSESVYKKEIDSITWNEAVKRFLDSVYELN